MGAAAAAAVIGAITNIIGSIMGITNTVTSGVQNHQQMQQNQNIADLQAQIAREGMQKDLDMNQQNIEAQREINEANLANQNQQNEIMRAREDNAVQRRAADLQAAGINPLLAGAQGASAQPGGMIAQQAPIADTSIGSRFAQNMIGLLDSLGQRESERRTRFSENMHETNRHMMTVAAQLESFCKTGAEIRLLKAQYENLNADTKKKFEEITKIQKEVEEKTVNITKTKEDTKYIKEMITSEPLKRALLNAQTKAQYENIKMFQQRILNMKEERINEVIGQTEKLQKIEIDKQTKAKIQREVEILMIEGDIKEFQRSMLKLDKTTSVSKEYIQMFTSIFNSIWGK